MRGDAHPAQGIREAGQRCSEPGHRVSLGRAGPGSRKRPPPSPAGITRSRLGCSPALPARPFCPTPAFQHADLWALGSACPTLNPRLRPGPSRPRGSGRLTPGHLWPSVLAMPWYGPPRLTWVSPISPRLTTLPCRKVALALSPPPFARSSQPIDLKPRWPSPPSLLTHEGTCRAPLWVWGGRAPGPLGASLTQRDRKPGDWACGPLCSLKQFALPL